jgi:cell division protein FtsL
LGPAPACAADALCSSCNGEIGQDYLRKPAATTKTNIKEKLHHMSYQTTQQLYSSRRRPAQSAWNRNQNTVAFVSSVKLGPVAHTVLIALMITILGLIYLTQATRATSYDYEAQKIDSQIAELSTKKGDLEVENARLTALENVQNSNVAKAMTTPSSTNYAR